MNTIVGSTFTANEKPVSTSAPNTKRTPASVHAISASTSARISQKKPLPTGVPSSSRPSPSWSAIPQPTVRHGTARRSSESAHAIAIQHTNPSADTARGVRSFTHPPYGLRSASPRCAKLAHACASSRTAASGDAEPATAEITAKPAAPAARTDASRVASIPPIATTGSGAARATASASAASPRALHACSFERVAKTGPNAT
jgi:hypothetical protein